MGMGLAYYMYMSEAEKTNGFEDPNVYVRINLSNGYCGCEETVAVKFPVDTPSEEIDKYAEEEYYEYMCSWDDERFVDYDEYDDPDEAFNDYCENGSHDWEYITKEQFDELKG